MEYFCVSCGARFSADVVHDRSSTKCPVCGISTCQGCRLVIGSTCEDVGVISMLDKSTVLLRAGKITCFYDADFVPRYEKREMYRTIDHLHQTKNPPEKADFLLFQTASEASDAVCREKTAWGWFIAAAVREILR